MTTASARPDELQTFAAHLASIDRLDDDLARVRTAAAAYAASCAGAVPVVSVLQAGGAFDRAVGLARGVRQVASAFLHADGNGRRAIVHIAEHKLLDGLEKRFPGLTSGAIGAAREVERGIALGRRIAAAGLDEARKLLAPFDGGHHLDPDFASGVLSGLGSKGLVATYDIAATTTGAVVTDRRGRERMMGDLASLLSASGRANDVHPARDLIHDLGRTAAGRVVLRRMVEHLHLHGPAPSLTVALGEALALGPPAARDATAHHAGPSRFELLPRTDDHATLRLLGADPAACLELERRHPGAALQILDRAPDKESASLAAVCVGHVVNGTVRTGATRAWTGVGPPPSGLAHDTLLDLPKVAVELDDRLGGAPAGVSRMLAETARIHPGLVHRLRRPMELDGVGSERDEPKGPTLSQFFEVVARDGQALATATTTLGGQRAAALGDLVHRNPPGRLDAHDVDSTLQTADDEVFALAKGADRAGQGEHPALEVAIRVGATAIAVALPWAAGQVAGAVGTDVAGPIAGAAFGDHVRDGVALPTKAALGKLEGAADDRWGTDDDDREEPVLAVVGEDESALLAQTLATDRRWSTRLHGSVPAMDGTAAGAARLQAWIDRQDPEVRALFGNLAVPRTGR